MGVALREIFALFDIKVDTGQLEKANAKLDSFVAKAVNAAKTLGTAFGVQQIGAFFERQIEQAAHLGDLAARLDVSATALREFGYAGETAGVGLDASARALGFLEKAQGGALNGNKANVKAFKEVGVVAKDAQGNAKALPVLLGEIADKFAEMPNQALRAAAATKLFGRAGRDLLPLLDQGGDRIRELMADAKRLGNGLGDDFYKNAKKARDEGNKFGFALQSIKDRLTAALLPGIQAVLEKLVDLAERFLDFTKRTNFLTTATEFLATLLSVKLARALYGVAKALGIVKETALATLTSFLRFAAIGAIITFVYYAFDDLWTLLHGGESLIGDILDKVEGKGASAKFVKEIKQLWEDIKKAVNEAGDALDEFFGNKDDGSDGKITFVKELDKELHKLLETARWVVKEFRELVGLVHDLTKSSGSTFAHPDASKEAAKLGTLAADVFEKDPHASIDENGGALINRRDPEKSIAAPADPRGFRPRFVGRKLEPFMGPIPDGDPTSPIRFDPSSVIKFDPVHIKHFGGGGSTTTVQQHNDVKVDVHGVKGDPKEIGKAVGAGISTEHEKNMRNALAATVAP